MIIKKDSFKNRFLEVLEIKDVRCSDLSRLTGIRESTLSQYKSGYAEPKSDKLSIIAQALNVDPVWLMGMDVPMEKRKAELTEDNAAALADLVKDGRQFDYIKKINELSPEKKEALYSYIDFLNSTK